MHILFWSIVAVIIAAVIARYNESNKLFWHLTLALLSGIMIGTIVYDETHSDEKKEVTMQVDPMQPSTVMDLFAIAADNDLLLDTFDFMSKVAGKGNTPATYLVTSNVPSLCGGNIRSQPLLNYLQLRGPTVEYINDS